MDPAVLPLLQTNSFSDLVNNQALAKGIWLQDLLRLQLRLPVDWKIVKKYLVFNSVQNGGIWKLVDGFQSMRGDCCQLVVQDSKIMGLVKQGQKKIVLLSTVEGDFKSVQRKINQKFEIQKVVIKEEKYDFSYVLGSLGSLVVKNYTFSLQQLVRCGSHQAYIQFYIKDLFSFLIAKSNMPQEQIRDLLAQAKLSVLQQKEERMDKFQFEAPKQVLTEEMSSPSKHVKKRTISFLSPSDTLEYSVSEQNTGNIRSPIVLESNFTGSFCITQQANCHHQDHTEQIPVEKFSQLITPISSPKNDFSIIDFRKQFKEQFTDSCKSSFIEKECEVSRVKRLHERKYSSIQIDQELLGILTYVQQDDKANSCACNCRIF